MALEYLAFDYAALFLMLVIVMWYFLEKRIPLESHKIFLIMLTTTFVATGMEIFSTRLSFTQDLATSPVFWVSATICTLAVSYVPIIFSYYIHLVAHVEVRKKKLQKNVFAVCLILNTVLIATNPFHRAIFDMVDNRRVTGLLGIIPVMIAVLMFVMCVASLIVNTKQVEISKLSVLIFNILSIMAAFLVQYDTRCMVLNFILATVCLTLYYNLHNPASVTDAVTHQFNRQFFGYYVTYRFDTNKNFGIILIAMDDFKFINDMYGHASGDQALQNLTSGMKEFFPKSTLIGRNGGDEFCLLLPGQTIETAQSCFQNFTEICREFTYEGIRHPFTISLGFAEYPAQAQTRKRLMQCADTALYEVKLNGKQGCRAYSTDPREARAQLGFALKDISAHLPGAFLIYKADPQDDQLLFANQEMVRLAGCNSIKEFFDYTKRSFRNLISEPEQTDIEESIWQQINEGDGHSNDYVSFSLVRKDGTLRKVFDHGRIVNNSYYGRVFYVLLMDQELMGQHYGIQDK